MKCSSRSSSSQGQGLIKVKVIQDQGYLRSRPLKFKVTQGQGHLRVTLNKVKVILESNGNVFRFLHQSGWLAFVRMLIITCFVLRISGADPGFDQGGAQIVTGLKLPFWGLSFVEFWCWGLIFGGQGGGPGPQGPPPGSAPEYVQRFFSDRFKRSSCGG